MNRALETMTRMPDCNPSHQPPTLDDVRQALTRPLPGLAAQLRMAPSYRAAMLRDRTPPPHPREAGVLVLLYPREGRLFFPLTRRTESVQDHKGQVSLPGGAREGNETLQETAWRETSEELHLSPEQWRSLGRLSPLYIPPSGFLITPFVAYSPVRPPFRPDPVEVAEVIETPLARLLDPSAVVREEWLLRGEPVEVPFFDIEGHKVWGATAMVLAEFVSLLVTARPPAG